MKWRFTLFGGFPASDAGFGHLLPAEALRDAFIRRPPRIHNCLRVAHGLQDIDAVLQPLVDTAHFNGHTDDLGHGLDEIHVIQRCRPAV